MAVAAKLDEWGPAAWIALMILGFMFWWPLGLATLGFLVWSGRMGCWRRGDVSRWQGWQGADRMKEAANRWRQGPSSGNRAFDEYRSETLRRLEEEQKEFRDFLDRLRDAKDKTEFDQFMADRRARGTNNGPSQQTS
jgi:hypothetical protein